MSDALRTPAEAARAAKAALLDARGALLRAVDLVDHAVASGVPVPRRVREAVLPLRAARDRTIDAQAHVLLALADLETSGGT